MVSISRPFRARRSRADYYDAQEYADKEERERVTGPSQWISAGAIALGLMQQLVPKDFLALARGVDPETERPLVKNADAKNRQAGWDHVFIADKSVSVTAALSPKAAQKELYRAQGESVEAAVRFMEDSFGFSRVGTKGEVMPAKLVAARIPHTKSRANDPHMHDHVPVFNVGVRADGTTGAIVSRALHIGAQLTDAVYRLELATKLAALGYNLKATEHGFAIADVPRQLLIGYSKRAEEMAPHITSESTPKQRKRAALITRAQKQVIETYDEQCEQWAREAEEYGHVQGETYQHGTPITEEEVAQLARGAREWDDFRAASRDITPGRDYQLIEQLLADEAARKTEVQENIGQLPGRPIKLYEALDRGVEGVPRKPGPFAEKLISLTTPTHAALLELIQRVTALGGIPVHITEQKIFPNAPRWNPASRLTKAKLQLGRYPYVQTKWTVLLTSKLRLSLRDQLLFPNAPEWSPAKKIIVPAFSIHHEHDR